MIRGNSRLGLEDGILVLGSTGLLGAALLRYFGSQGQRVATHGRGEGADFQADLSSAEESSALLDEVAPAIIVNLVGLTNVDRCEMQPNSAYMVNGRTVENVTSWMKRRAAACHLIQISTDQVYDDPGPHSEYQVTIRNYYALSKYCGELSAAGVSSTIVRTNFFGRSRCPKRQSFTDWLYDSLSGGAAINVFNDVLFSPLSMATVVEIVGLIMCKKPVGLFNLGSRQGMSKADFAVAFAGALNLSTQHMSCTSIERGATLKAYRPRDMRMDSSKIESALGIKLPNLIEEIRSAAGEYDAIA
jgi:dTDP-4-dehydrorhamnose reductase